MLGDTTLINLVIDGFFKPDYLIPLLQARFLPTQELMDDACRVTNVLYLPFRAQLLVKTMCEQHTHSSRRGRDWSHCGRPTTAAFGCRFVTGVVSSRARFVTAGA